MRHPNNYLVFPPCSCVLQSSLPVFSLFSQLPGCPLGFRTYQYLPVTILLHSRINLHTYTKLFASYHPPTTYCSVFNTLPHLIPIPGSFPLSWYAFPYPDNHPWTQHWKDCWFQVSSFHIMTTRHKELACPLIGYCCSPLQALTKCWCHERIYPNHGRLCNILVSSLMKRAPVCNVQWHSGAQCVSWCMWKSLMVGNHHDYIYLYYCIYTQNYH